MRSKANGVVMGTMNPQDYQVVVRKIAEEFVQSRLDEAGGDRSALLDRVSNNPSTVQFHGYMVSVFHAYHTPAQCASIIVASNSQGLDPHPWQGLPPRESLFAMAFHLFKNDVWHEVNALLRGSVAQDHLDDAGEQLTMFGAA